MEGEDGMSEGMIVIKVSLPSPLVGGRARRGESTGAVSAANEEFRAEVQMRAVNALTADQWTEPLFELANIKIRWFIEPLYVIPRTAVSLVRLGLEDGRIISSSRKHAKRVSQTITLVSEGDSTGLLVTVGEG